MLSCLFSFTPSDIVDMSKERDWPASLGLLDWDNTSIVFTKRSLLEFLKYAGITVDPNFTNIQKLPRYAQFGKISGEVTASAGESSAGPEASAAAKNLAPAVQATSDFKPTRRVRDPPGGRQHNIFGDDAGDDALAGAPPKPRAAVSYRLLSLILRLNRRTTSVAGLWDAHEPDTGFKPTRRVRERPGGKDSISGVSSMHLSCPFPCSIIGIASSSVDCLHLVSGRIHISWKLCRYLSRVL
ncbi:hypothetical protein BC628DRAFT_1310449 [Trametes gibbosa]|nr:hypothetical protein BC628DRAFT_1310449 [Trametes gibbosa]